MKKNRKNAGFTMLELIVVVAIIGILAGVAMINVTKYQRNLALKEADSAAKELFIAAQNHLTDADALGRLKVVRDNPGTMAGIGKTEKIVKDGVEKTEVNYVVAYPGTGPMPEIWKQMLPFGAIDETVRSGGSYIIHYNLDTATVLDVFYSDASDKRFGCDLTISDYNEKDGPNLKDKLPDIEGVDRKSVRRSVTLDDGRKNRVIGWYGGVGLSKPDSYIDQPTITVTNGDTLKVEVGAPKDKEGNTLIAAGKGVSMSLIVRGVTSNAYKEIKLITKNAGGNQEVLNDAQPPVKPCVRVPEEKNGVTRLTATLDNITASGGNFAAVMGDAAAREGSGTYTGGKTGNFIPGEDLDIWAVVFDNSKLSNIGESNRVRVNSLFGSLTKGEAGNTDKPDTVTIFSFRHLENLDASISSLDLATLQNPGEDKVPAVVSNSALKAVQVSDMNWKNFMEGDGGKGEYKYKPVVPTKVVSAGDPADIILTYEGDETATGAVVHSHRILNLVVEGTGENRGLFESLSDGSEVSNLDLVNFTVTGGKNAGALAGKTGTETGAGVTLTNVKVYNDVTATTGKTDDSAFEISGSVSVGGLVGEFTGKADKCAAAVYVKSSTNSGLSGSAGGLFGKATTTAIDNEGKGGIQKSYSGGHTEDGKYKTTKTDKKYADGKTEVYEAVMGDGEVGRVNVQGATAGGLIGTLSVGTVDNCYSTCSASGTTVGGFVGSSSGTINNSYCTGLVAKNRTIYIKESGDKVGLFVGDGSVGTGNSYLEIVNYIDPNVLKKENGKSAIPAVGSSSVTESQVKAFDKNASTYNTFVSNNTGDSSVFGYPYDNKLVELSDKSEQPREDGAGLVYLPKYSLKSVGQKTHYGDWPVYETYIVNTPS